jgi:acetamidase/formamidase
LIEDGEITGQGFETSMDVEFTVDLIQDELLDQPGAENGDFIMVLGVGGSLQNALQVAVVDPQFHVVAKIWKDMLAQLPRNHPPRHSFARRSGAACWSRLPQMKNC